MLLKNYAKNNWEKIIVITAGIFTILCIVLMAAGLYRNSAVEEIPEDLTTTPVSLSLISHEKYEDMIKSLSEPYTPGKLHTRNIFSEHMKEVVEIKAVRKIGEFKTPQERFEVVKIYKKPVELLFKGYMRLADGSYVSTLNWAGKTDFVMVGEEIRKYKVVDFKKDFVDTKTIWGGTDRVDKSAIVLERSNGERMILDIGMVTLEKEIYAEILDRSDNESYDVYIGSELSTYKILDISPEGVIIVDQKGVESRLVKGT